MSGRRVIGRAGAVLFLFALAGCQDSKGPTGPDQPTGTRPGGLGPAVGPAASSRTVTRSQPTQAMIQQVYWSADGKWLVTVSSDCTVTVWDPAEERKPPPARIGRHTFGQPAFMSVRAAVADDRLIDDIEQKFTVRQISTGQTVRVLNQSEHAYGDQFLLTDDGKRLVALNVPRQEFNAWDVGSGKLVHTKLPKTERQVEHLVGLSADGAEAYVVLAGIKEGDRYTDLPRDGIHAVTLETGAVELRVEHRLKADPGFHAIITTDRRFFIDDRSWDLKTGKETGQYPWHHVEAVSPDGRFAASFETVPADGRRVTIWDVSTRKKSGLLPRLAFSTGGTAIAFSPDGMLVALGGIRDWGIGLEPELRNWTPVSAAFNGGATHLDERALVLYDTQTQKRVRTLAFAVWPPSSKEVPQVDFP